MFSNSKFAILMAVMSGLLLAGFLQSVNAGGSHTSHVKHAKEVAVPAGSAQQKVSKTQGTPKHASGSTGGGSNPSSPRGAAKREKSSEGSSSSKLGGGKKKDAEHKDSHHHEEPHHPNMPSHEVMEHIKKALKEVLAKKHEEDNAHSVPKNKFDEHDFKAFEETIIHQVHLHIGEEANGKSAKNKDKKHDLATAKEAAKVPEAELKTLLEKDKHAQKDMHSAFMERILQETVEKVVKNVIEAKTKKTAHNHKKGDALDKNIENAAVAEVHKKMKELNKIFHFGKTNNAKVRNLVAVEMKKETHQQQIGTIKEKASNAQEAKKQHKKIAQEKQREQKKDIKHKAHLSHSGSSKHGSEKGAGSLPSSPSGASPRKHQLLVTGAEGGDVVMSPKAYSSHGRQAPKVKLPSEYDENEGGGSDNELDDAFDHNVDDFEQFSQGQSQKEGTQEAGGMQQNEEESSRFDSDDFPPLPSSQSRAARLDSSETEVVGGPEDSEKHEVADESEDSQRPSEGMDEVNGAPERAEEDDNLMGQGIRRDDDEDEENRSEGRLEGISGGPSEGEDRLAPESRGPSEGQDPSDELLEKENPSEGHDSLEGHSSVSRRASLDDPSEAVPGNQDEEEYKNAVDEAKEEEEMGQNAEAKETDKLGDETAGIGDANKEVEPKAKAVVDDD